MIAIATIGLSFLTQEGAKLIGIDLPEQTNIEIVKRCLSSAFVSAKHFGVAAFLVAQVLVLLPIIEEVVFRWGLFKLPVSFVRRARSGDAESLRVNKEKALSSLDAVRHRVPTKTALFIAVISSALFSAAHYIAQPWPDNAFLALFFFGLAQCWLYRRTGRLWCSVTNHFLFNLTNLVLLFVARARVSSATAAWFAIACEGWLSGLQRGS